jgi:hypothetical protein
VEEDKLEKTGQYCIRVRKGDWEIEVSAPEGKFVLSESARLIEDMAFTAEATPTYETAIAQEGNTLVIESGHSRNTKPQSLNEFFRQFRLQTHQEKILILGYWCEVKQGQPFFTSEDILARYKEVKELPPANIRRDIGILQGKGLLLSAGKTEDRAYALTNTGINDVESKM